MTISRAGIVAATDTDERHQGPTVARGVGLLLLVGLMALVGPISYSAAAIVSAASGGLMIVGIIGLVGVELLRRETRWLRDHLRDPAKSVGA